MSLWQTILKSSGGIYVRATYLVLAHRAKLALTRCSDCGTFGVESVSMFFPKKLCRFCDQTRRIAEGL